MMCFVLFKGYNEELVRKGFAAECKRQSGLINNDHQEDEILMFLDETADCEGWTI